MSRFSAKSAKEIMMAKQDSFDKTLETIRLTVDSTIKDAAKMGKGSVSFKIPANVFGHEPYNPAEMGKALVDQLFADGYEVTGTYSNTVISWASKSETKIRKQGYCTTKPVVKVPQIKKS
jgi:hypothetical protein